MHLDTRGPSMSRRTALGLAAASALVLSSACGRAAEVYGTSGTGQSVLPTQTAEHWVTYADFLTTLVARTERRGTPPAEEVERGEGFIARLLDLEIASAVWTRPTLNNQRDVPAKILMANGGWTFHGDEETRMRYEGQEWMELGSTYLGLITFGDVGYTFDAPTGSPEWMVLQLLPLDGSGQVARSSEMRGLHKSLVGRTSAEVAEVLAATPADPIAGPYMTLDPVLRFQKVMAKTNDPGEPAPGESP